MSKEQTKKDVRVDAAVRRKVGDKIKFKGVGFLGADIFDAEIISIDNSTYKAKMDVGYIVFLNENNICA